MDSNTGVSSSAGRRHTGDKRTVTCVTCTDSGLCLHAHLPPHTGPSQAVACPSGPLGGGCVESRAGSPAAAWPRLCGAQLSLAMVIEILAAPT